MQELRCQQLHLPFSRQQQQMRRQLPADLFGFAEAADQRDEGGKLGVRYLLLHIIILVFYPAFAREVKTILNPVVF